MIKILLLNYGKDTEYILVKIISSTQTYFFRIIKDYYLQSFITINDHKIV